MKGRYIPFTIPAGKDMSAKDLRKYIFGCAEGIEGSKEDHGKICELVRTSGVYFGDILRDPMRIRYAALGEFMENEAPGMPILDGAHVIFVHPDKA